jgi:N utilization substance protein A
MKNELIMAINNICVERELEPQVVFEAIEAALVSAHRRRFGMGPNVQAKVDPKSGEIKIFIEKEVVTEVEDDRSQISLAKARAIDTTADLGGIVLVENTPKNFGRIAAQTAKQVILQRIREAERDAIYQRYQSRVGEIVHCAVRSIEYGTGIITCTIDGKAEGALNKEDQIPTERYRVGSKLRCYLVDVERGNRGPAIRLSRTHRGLLRRLLEQEVPEIYNGSVEIKSIAREPGQRSKVAVAAIQPGVDPVGSCVGMRGVRIQAIVNELNGEKIDVIEWNNDPGQFIASALSPAKVATVVLDDTLENRTAIVVVPDKQLSLAIGKEGQNARLSAKLTGWRIDIKSETEAEAEGLDQYAKELSIKRSRLAAARARAESEDILSVAEQLLADDLVPTEAVEVEGAEEAYADDYADEYAEEYGDEYAEEYGEEYGEVEEPEAVMPSAEPAGIVETPVAEFASAEATAEPFAEGVDEYALYDEYAQYEQPAGEGDVYDEYAQYGDYDEYALYEGYDEDQEPDEGGTSSTAVADSRDKKPKKAGKQKDKRKGAKERPQKRGRSDWYNYNLE